MSKKDLNSRLYIKFCRFILNQRFMRVMDGPLKGYMWSTNSNYDYILGTYENPLVLRTCEDWFKNDTVFYDLGANVGFFALLANQYITSGKIYSFEPIAFIRELFQQHLKLNKVHIRSDNIQLFPFGISDKEKEIPFSHSTIQREGNTYILNSPIIRKDGNAALVKCYAIDELVRQGYDPPTVIKIDVEGAEYDVLKGALDTIIHHRPNILLATHDCHLPGVDEQCTRLLTEQGYLLKNAGNYNCHNTGLANYIAVHSSRG